ncbi:MAG TPA: PglZ domain-containing protein, partial [Ktedonobacteraceae bacterium]|nr:PglZ domain-containing protein [Ktedonobacteraceae bacterium]
GSMLAEQFLRSFQAARFQIPDAMRQVEIFDKHIQPVLQQGKVAYVLVDALRYEMGRELAQTLIPENSLELSVALGTVPTITVIGMAALLPGAQEQPRLVAPSNGKVALELDGVTLKDRKGRIEFLKKHAGVSVFDARLDELLPKPTRRVQEGTSKADLIVITSQEIDLLGEKGNIAIARQTMEVALSQLQQAFRTLGQLGVKTIICTADHGYLFAEELSDDMKIDPPGGKEIDLHRRVWIGQGGTADASYLRTHVSDFGLESELDIAIPWNFACFKKQGGAEAYFHGGVSPQEFFIPVLTLKSKTKVSDTSGNLLWQLTLGSKKITTRLCSVQITGKTSGLFPLTPPKIRLEIRSGQECISLPVSAAHGFEEATGNIQLEVNTQDPQQIEPNVIALAILKESPKANVSLHLLDAVTGLELHRLDTIEMAISI